MKTYGSSSGNANELKKCSGTGNYNTTESWYKNRVWYDRGIGMNRRLGVGKQMAFKWDREVRKGKKVGESLPQLKNNVVPKSKVWERRFNTTENFS